MQFAVVATAILAALIALFGLAMMIRPLIFTGLAQFFIRPWGVWLAAGIRLFAALALWFAAPASRYPQLFKVLAGVALFAAVAVLVVGHERIKTMIEWAMKRPHWVLRSWAALAIGIGAFVLWALSG